MKNFYHKIREYIPIVPLVIFIFTIISAILYIIYINSVTFADFMNYNLSAPFRMIISFTTSIIPFSIAEMLILLSPLWIALLIYLAIKFGKMGKKQSIRYLCVLLSILCFIFIAYAWTYTSGYHNTPIEDKMELNRENIDKNELYDTSVIIIDNLNKLANEITYDENKASQMEYSYYTMSAKICDAYSKFVKKHPITRTFWSNVKPLIISEPMTYTHLSGIYSFMTGEANVNVNYPDFIVATSSAHEMAHQRGVAREDEANFIAFAVLSGSDDAFLKYSAYLDVFSYVISDLRKADKELYKEAISSLDIRVREDYNSYVEFFQKYANSTASEVTDKINNSYLQANGQVSGTKSYAMVSELVCAYLLNRTK